MTATDDTPHILWAVIKIESLIKKANYSMANVRKNHTAEFKTKVAVEAILQQKTINELTTEYGVHATQINLWKKQG
ncbi:MAG: transposase [Methylococcaceae bacterium]